MNLKRMLIVSVVALSVTASLSCMAATKDLKNFSSDQQEQIKGYVDRAVPSYLMAHPKVIISAVNRYQQQARERALLKAKTVISAKMSNFLRYPASPVQNPNGKVTLVEFYDYQCSVCHMMYPIINQVAKDNPNLRIVYKDLPIFGPASVYAAKISIAAYAQSPKEFAAYHDALFKSGLMEGKLKKADIDAIAKKSGLNMVKIKQVINSPIVNQALSSNGELAQALQLTGTPAIIVVPTKATNKTPANEIGFVPGGATKVQLDQMVKSVAKFVGK